MDLVIGLWLRGSKSMEVVIGTSPHLQLDHGTDLRLPYYYGCDGLP
jgi:hypothetical protein